MIKNKGDFTEKVLPWLLAFLFIAAIIASIVSSAKAEYNAYTYLFSGRWQPSVSPLLVDEGGFQDIQNMRRIGNGLRGVSGHTPLTETVIDGGTRKYIENGFHFKKDQPAESHILVSSRNSTDTGYVIFSNSAVIPSGTGAFSVNALTSGSGPAVRFSKAPQGNILVTDGEESMIWGGNEMPHTALMTASSATISIAFESLKDYGAKLKNASQESGQTATINTTTARRLLIGVTRPLQGIKIYVKTPNTENPTQDLEVQEWRGHGYWDSYDKWRQVSSLVDNTDGLTQTGTVTWDYSGVAWDVGGTAASRYIGGYQLYWYYCWLKAGSAEIYQVTVDAPMQRITNTWDGSARGLAKAMVYDASAGTYYDYTDEVISNDSAYYMEASTAANPLTTDDYILLGFVEPQRGFNIKMAEGNINTSASTSLVYYWGGESWVYGKKQEDGTSEDSKSLAKSGVVSFENVIPLEPEFKRSIGDDVALYYYKIRFNAALSSSDVFIYYITGIASPEVIPAYDFPGFFRNRSWLFSETGGDRNKAVYSAYNSPDVWNGPDTGELYFGNGEKLTAAGVIHSLFETTGISQLIVTKNSETYRVFGDNPDNWVVQRMSDHVGCPAPLTMAQAQVTVGGRNQHVLIWQSGSGVVMSDGTTIHDISEDISAYFDQNDSRAIPLAMLSKSTAWYDSVLGAYKLLIGSGAGATTLNTELEFDLKTNSWTKIYRENGSGANPFQCGFMAEDTTGVKYAYGATDEGLVYRTETGTSWDGEDIVQFVQTKDLLVSSEIPYLKDTVLDYVRLTFENRSGATEGEDISFVHYCDRDLTVDGTNYQDVPSDVSLNTGPLMTTGVTLGPCTMHSFKISADVNSVADGLELTGMGFYYTPLDSLTIGE